MTKFMAKVIVVICFSIFATFTTSYANVNATAVAVEQVTMAPGSGGTTSGFYVILKNTSGVTIAGSSPAWTNNTTRGFYLSQPLGNAGLAIVLSALSNKTKVSANIAGTAASGSLIMTIGVTQISQ